MIRRENAARRDALCWIVSRIAADRSIYANISSAFETPTATELGNQPDGTAGINEQLAPQKSTTYEVGSKGGFGGHLLRCRLVQHACSRRARSVRDTRERRSEIFPECRPNQSPRGRAGAFGGGRPDRRQRLVQLFRFPIRALRHRFRSVRRETDSGNSDLSRAGERDDLARCRLRSVRGRGSGVSVRR